MRPETTTTGTPRRWAAAIHDGQSSVSTSAAASPIASSGVVVGAGTLHWTAWEAVSLWMFANDKIPYISFRSSPVYFVLLMIAVIFIRMIHFYWIHRLLHTNLFYRFHALHHRNTDVGPWSLVSSLVRMDTQ